MANTTIKISQLPSIGNATTANTLFPVVNTNGTFTTQKVTIGNVANFTLNEAGNLFPPAFLSTYALNVINADQPNITSTGTLANLTINNIANLHIPGGTSGDFISTDGNGNLSWVNSFGALINYRGNIGNLSFEYANNSVLMGSPSSYLKLSANDTRLADDLNNVEIWAAGEVFVFDLSGKLTVPNSVLASGNVDAGNMLISNTATIGNLSVRIPGTGPNVLINQGNIYISNNITGNGNITANGFIKSNTNITAVGNVVGNRLVTANGLYWSNGTPYSSGASGSNTQVQFNDNNSLGSNAGFTFDKTSGNLNVPTFVNAGAISSTGLVEGQNFYVNGNLHAYNYSILEQTIPSADDAYDLGESGNQWSNLYVSTVTTAKAVPLQFINGLGNVVITSGSGSWSFTNEGSGNTYFPPNSFMTTTYGSMYVQSKGDYYVYGYNQPAGVDNEGGRIAFYSGNGSAANATTIGGDGGYIRLYAGDGGQSSSAFSGGDGGYIRLIAGDGADAIGISSVAAKNGGNVNITAGSAGTEDSVSALGANGGNITLSAGNSTLLDAYGGNIILNSGTSTNGPKGIIGLNGIVALENAMTIDNSVLDSTYIGGTDTTIGIVENNPTAGFYITTNQTGTQYQWYYDNSGGISSPVNNNTATYVTGSITQIKGDPFPSSAPQQTVTTIWTASSWDVIGAKVNLRVQSTDFTEIVEVDIAKEYSNANVTFAVYGRLKTNSTVNSTIMNAVLDGSNNLSLTANCQALGFAYYTYDVKEYKYTYD